MSGHLRHVALTVEETQGGFAWLLFESAGGKLLVLERGRKPYDTYLQALQAGFEELALLSACGLHERGVGHVPAAAAPQQQAPSREPELVEFD